MPNKLNNEQMEKLKYDYRRGLLVPELCNIYNICSKTLGRYLVGVEKTNKSRKKSTATFRNKAIIADFKGGLVNLPLLANKYNIQEATVRRILITNKAIEPPIQGYGKDMRRKVIALRAKNVKVKDIADQLGVSFDYTRKVITEHRKETGLYTGKAGKPSDNPKPRNIRKGRAYGELRTAVAEEMAKGEPINRTQFALEHGTTKQRVSQLIKALKENYNNYV